MILTCVCEFNVCYIHVWLFMVIETIIYLNQILIGLHWHGPWFIICHVSVDSHVSPSSSMFCYHNHVLSDVSSNEWIWESCSVVILMDSSNWSFPYRFPWFPHIVYMICCSAFSPTDIQSASAGTLRWEATVRQESKGVYVGDCPNRFFGFLKMGGIPKAMAFNMRMAIHDLDDLGLPPILGNLHNIFMNRCIYIYTCI